MRAVCVAVIALGLALPSLASGSAGEPAKKRCRVVVKKVHGTKKRVRVCTSPKPKPKPKPPAIRRIDVGGYKLAIECRGSGRPAVVLDSGFSTPRTAWTLVFPRVSTATRVCSYDRAGLGRSDRRPGQAPPTTSTVVDELHTLLPRAGLRPPYILGGWSIGGFDVRYYAKRYPAEVAGLVLVDATPPSFLLNSPEPLESGLETMYTHAAAAELEPPPSLAGVPLVDLTHGIPLEDPAAEAQWVQEQKRITRSSRSSTLVRATNSGHDIAGENPALVAAALKLVVGAARGASPLPACTATGLPSLGGACLDASAP